MPNQQKYVYLIPRFLALEYFTKLKGQLRFADLPAMVDHIEEFRIEFEQAENVFFTGENICGEIRLKFSSPSQIRGIQMTLTGKGTEFLPIKRPSNAKKCQISGFLTLGITVKT